MSGLVGEIIDTVKEVMALPGASISDWDGPVLPYNKWDVLHSSKKQDWQTPLELFSKVNEIFQFTLDCASQEENRMCRCYRSAESPAEWNADNEVALWLNPPFSPTKLCRSLVEDVISKAEISEIPAVILLPARTDTKLWNEVIFRKCVVWFLGGRLTFVGAPAPAPFPTALCVAGPMTDVQMAALVDLSRELGGTICCMIS